MIRGGLFVAPDCFCQACSAVSRRCFLCFSQPQAEACGYVLSPHSRAKHGNTPINNTLQFATNAAHNNPTGRIRGITSIAITTIMCSPRTRWQRAFTANAVTARSCGLQPADHGPTKFPGREHGQSEVHNTRKRGKALLHSLIERLPVQPPRNAG